VATLCTATARRNPIACAEILATIPNPAKVRATAAEIRRGWSTGERRRRAEIARSMFMGHLVADLFDPPRHACLTLTPKSRPWH